MVKVAHIFSTSGHTVSYKLGRMILPQLEEGRHGAEVDIRRRVPATPLRLVVLRDHGLH